MIGAACIINTELRSDCKYFRSSEEGFGKLVIKGMEGGESKDRTRGRGVSI